MLSPAPTPLAQLQVITCLDPCHLIYQQWPLTGFISSPLIMREVKCLFMFSHPLPPFPCKPPVFLFSQGWAFW